MIKVAKFGGSSLADAECIKNIARIIKADSTRRFIVVSAPGKRFDDDSKITDLLYACAGCRGVCGESFNTARARLNEIIEGLGIDFDIDSEIALIKNNIESGADADYIASRGEYLIALIISKYLGYEFIDSCDLIKFKGEVFDAALTKKLTAKRLEGVEYAVIPGFYGSRMDGTIKTFSRGGSDYSGALIAEAVEAEVYENWTDVDGFMATDPRLIKNPHKINDLSYDEVYRLSKSGATVLHPCSVLPLKKSKIKLSIKNSFNPNSEGTMITPTGASRVEELAGISVKRDCQMLLVSHQTADKGIVVKRLFNLLSSLGSRIEFMSAGIGTVELTLKEQLSEKQFAYLESRLTDMEINQNSLTLISLVGYRGKDLVKRVFSVIDEIGEIKTIGYKDGIDLILALPSQKEITPLLTSLYNEFFKHN